LDRRRFSHKVLDPQEPWSNVETMSLAAILIRTGNDINVYPGYQLACRVGRKIKTFFMELHVVAGREKILSINNKNLFI
jgi:hypothetical protein